MISLFAILLHPGEDINLTDNNPVCKAHIREDACTIVIPSKYPICVLRMPQTHPAHLLGVRHIFYFLCYLLLNFTKNLCPHPHLINRDFARISYACPLHFRNSPLLLSRRRPIATTGRSDSFQASLSVIQLLSTEVVELAGPFLN